MQIHVFDNPAQVGQAAATLIAAQILRSPNSCRCSSSVIVSLAMDGRLNAAKRTPTLTRMDFAVLPETDCQGFFNQIHKKSTKKVPEAPYGS